MAASNENEHESPAPVVAAAAGHEKHCFVVMPFGREPPEQKWFRGWFEVVVKPAVLECGYAPVLAAAEEQPGAINDEIRTHLAVDEMVIVDLGGAEPEDEPNPNVMYELGIRHALGLPLVMMAWKGQRLPFDVSNQRVIMEDRDLLDIEPNKRRLVTFIKAASQGRYYRPMEAVSRMVTIQTASESASEDPLLRALAHEVRELRVSVTASASRRMHGKVTKPVGEVKRLVGEKAVRKVLYSHYIACGGPEKLWSRVLKSDLAPEEAARAAKWSVDEWKAWIATRAAEAQSWAAPPAQQPSNSDRMPASSNTADLDQSIAQIEEPLAADTASGNSLTP